MAGRNGPHVLLHQGHLQSKKQQKEGDEAKHRENGGRDEDRSKKERTKKGERYSDACLEESRKADEFHCEAWEDHEKRDEKTKDLLLK